MQNVHEPAVSPVVGVMLMLVVVLIIAAIVSGFAGSLVQTNNKAPQATIKGTCYVNASVAGSKNLVVLTHAGGDAIVPAKVQVIIKKGDEWGSYTDILEGGYAVIASSAIHDSTNKFWMNATSGGTEVLDWRPGESVYIDYSGASSTDVGKSLDLEINTIDGKLISKSKMPVVP